MNRLIAMTCTVFIAHTAQAATINFDELNPLNRPAYNAANPGFVSQGTTFFGGSYSGWTYSNDNDTTTPGFTNQYAAYTGTDSSGTGNYAVAFPPYGSPAVIDLPAGQTPTSVLVTNTTYAALSMLHGDDYAKQFGGVTGDDPDFFDVIFTGHDAAGGTGNVTGTSTFRLADYTFGDNAQDYIVDMWESLDLTPLGAAVSISLSWSSSDVGTFGINTPTYVAIDNLILVPEPASVMLLAGAMSLLCVRRR
jgi:hypothetical protein